MTFFRIFSLALAVCFAALAPAEAMKPMLPLTVRASLEGTPEPGRPVDVRLEIHSMINAPRATVRWILPDGVEMIADSVEWEGELTAGMPKVLNFVLSVEEAGRYLVRAKVLMEFLNGTQMGQTAHLWIDTMAP